MRIKKGRSAGVRSYSTTPGTVGFITEVDDDVAGYISTRVRIYRFGEWPLKCNAFVGSNTHRAGNVGSFCWHLVKHLYTVYCSISCLPNNSKSNTYLYRVARVVGAACFEFTHIGKTFANIYSVGTLCCSC